MPDIAAQIGGEYRLMPKALWDALEGPKPAVVGHVVESICDGCTASPDWFRRRPLWPACVVHNWHYKGQSPLGATWGARRKADTIFRRNLEICMRLAPKPVNAVVRKAVAYTYWLAVRKAGGVTFHYEEGEETAEAPWIQRIREIFGIFKAKLPDQVEQD